MKSCRKSLRSLLGVVIGALVAVACPRLSEATCHATDFDLKQIQAIAKEVDSTKENLAALISVTPNIRAATAEFAFLLGTAATVKGQGKLVVSFAFSLLIYSDMATAADRKTVDDYIGKQAAWIYRDTRSEADYLTPFASRSPNVGGEIREARDLVRKMQTLFSCAADDK